MSSPEHDNDAEQPERALSPAEAREQAAEAMGFLASKFYDVGNGEKLELPNPEFFDDDQQAAYDALKLESKSWDHEDIVARNPLTGEVIFDPKTGEPVVDHVMCQPNRKTDENGNVKLVENFNVQLCKILWGDAGYAKFKAAGGRANQVMVDLQLMQRKLRARMRTDPKSADGGVAGSAVSDRDRNDATPEG